jgi:prevent-host-death family protein
VLLRAFYLTSFIARKLVRKEVKMDRKMLENLVSITELSAKASAVVSKAEAGDIQYVLKRNKPVAAIISIELLKAIHELSAVWHKDLDGGEWESIIDYAATVLSVRAAMAEPGEPLELDKLYEEFGVTREQLDED